MGCGFHREVASVECGGDAEYSRSLRVALAAEMTEEDQSQTGTLHPSNDAERNRLILRSESHAVSKSPAPLHRANSRRAGSPASSRTWA